MSIEEVSQFKNPYDYWMEEIKSAQKRVKKWHKKGDKTINRFLDTQDETAVSDTRAAFRLNLFHANIITMRSMLYGRTPHVDVARRYADPDDDVGRVAAEMLARMLNNDIEVAGEDFASILRSALDDRLLPGFGSCRIKYAADFEEVEIPPQMDGDVEMAPGYTEESLVSETAEPIYTHWRDVLWGYGRNYSDVKWWGFRTNLKKAEIEERFGKEAADNIELKQMTPEEDNTSTIDIKDNWETGEIWEIWCKDDKKVHWISPGYTKELDVKDDPLQLEGFFPNPPPMMANLTTTLYLPKPDYAMSQDLYQEIDYLQTRISIITKAVKVVGVYDGANEGVKRMLSEGVENDLIPVDNWAMFAEKGGIQGTVDWFPVQDVVNTLDKLRGIRDETIQLLYQVSGMSDIMRGAAASGGGNPESATASALKGRFASVRIQALQDEFARFASDLQRIKAEIICKHYDAQTIYEQSGIQFTSDAELAPQAIELLQNYQAAMWRIEIRPETVAMVDYAQLKSERTEYITALATFMQSAAPLVAQSAEAAPFLLEMLKWGLAGFKGSSQIEGVVDQAISMYQKQLAQPKQEGADPEAQKAQAKMQQDQMKMQADMQKMQAKANAELQKLNAQLQAELIKIQAKTQGAIEEEKAQAKYNLLEKGVDAKIKMAQGGMNK